MSTAYRINWIEIERGWGTRDDGYSLHISVDIPPRLKSWVSCSGVS